MNHWRVHLLFVNGLIQVHSYIKIAENVERSSEAMLTIGWYSLLEGEIPMCVKVGKLPKKLWKWFGLNNKMFVKLMSEFARKSVWFHQYEGMKEVAQNTLRSFQTPMSTQSEMVYCSNYSLAFTLVTRSWGVYIIEFGEVRFSWRITHVSRTRRD